MKYVLIALLSLLFSATLQAAPDLLEAERLIRGGSSEAAFKLLSPVEFEMAGNAQYDYLLGIAALESGRSDRATLILERVLAVDPLHAAARLDIARAYFALGDYDRSQREFLALRQMDPPQGALITIERYLTAIDERRQQRSTRYTAYVEAGFGTDSNLNAGPSQSQVYVGAFGGFLALGASSRQLLDNYNQLAVGGEVTHSLNGRLAVFAGADIKLRDYQRFDEYDYGSGDARVGLQLSDGKDVYRINAGYNDYQLAVAAYRKTHSLGADWRRAIDSRTQVTAFGQVAQLRYAGQSLRANDIDQWMFGGGLMWQPAGADASVLALSAYAGEEMEVETRTDGNKSVFGGRIGGQKTLGGNVDVFASLAFQTGYYTRKNTLFETVRKDYQYDLTFGSSWRFARHWSLRPQLTWTLNDSNLSIYDYGRYDVGVFLRRDFQ